MGLKKAENQVKILLAETILSMCRNTLPYHAEICVEGLLGITLDNEEIFLVNINQTIKNQIEGPSAASKANESLKRSRKEQDNEGSESDPESSSNESEESSSKKRRKRGRRKKQKGEKSGSESDDGNLADESANVEATSLLPGADLTEVKFHNISPPDENPDGSEQYYDNSNQTADNDSQDATPSGVNVTVKQEPPGGPESDDDLVFVKQEVDDFNLAQPSSHQFSNLSQVFGNSSADTSLSQPDFMSSAFFNNPANNMSANAMQQAAVPGPSGANAGSSCNLLSDVPRSFGGPVLHLGGVSVFSGLQGSPGTAAQGGTTSSAAPGGNKANAAFPGGAIPTDPRNGICYICGMNFRWPSLLKRHILTHTGERPYCCNLCGKTFNNKYNMMHHVNRIHAGIKYTCKPRVSRAGNARAPVSDDARAPPTEKANMPPSAYTEAPPSDNTNVPPSEDIKVPPSEDTLAPPSEDTVLPPSDDH